MMEGRMKNCFYTEYMALNAGIDRARSFVTDKRKDSKIKEQAYHIRTKDMVLPRPATVMPGNPKPVNLQNNALSNQGATLITGTGNIKDYSSFKSQEGRKVALDSRKPTSNSTLPILSVKSMHNKGQTSHNAKYAKAHSAPQTRQWARFPYTVQDYNVSIPDSRLGRVRSGVMDGRGGATPANSMATAVDTDPLERLKRRLNLQSAFQKRAKKLTPTTSGRRARTQQYDPPMGPVFACQMLGITHVCFPVPAEKCVNKLIVFDPQRVDRDVITRRDVRYISFSVPKRVALKSESLLDSKNATQLELLKREFKDDPIVGVSGYDVDQNGPMDDFKTSGQVNETSQRVDSNDIQDEGLGDEL